MGTEKDRLGEKLREAEKGQENQYFARRDRELLDEMRRKKEQEFREELRASAAAVMLCPRCGQGMTERTQHGVRVDECASCGGLWLDKGEFEILARRETEGWFGRLFRARESGPA